jgi:D-alanine-D-alanine ligase
MSKPTVAVLFGGRSSEHGVSCVTASGVLGAIDRNRWNVVAIAITPDGQWVPASTDPESWKIVGAEMPSVASSDRTVLLPHRAGERMWRVEHDGNVAPLAQIDVVFPLLHGPWGEDGTVQGALELVNARYVGSGVLASAIGMDKEFMKTALTGAGLPVTPGVVIRASVDLDSVRASIEQLGMPVFVKPARAGSSMGISRVEAWDDLRAAVDTAGLHDPKVLIEKAIVGREIETAVLVTSEGVKVSPAGEIVTGGDHTFYDFEAKYLDEGHVELRCPTKLHKDVAATVADYARRAFHAVAAEGLARVDCFVSDDGTVTVNEINTMPGFTTTSMYPRMWAAASVTYPDLVETMLRHALTRPVGLR